jgi:hypothetical protein
MGFDKLGATPLMNVRPPAPDIWPHALTTEKCQSTKSLRDSGAMWLGLSVIPR